MKRQLIKPWSNYEQQAQLVEPERTVRQGDLVTIDYTGYVGGQAFPNGAATDVDLIGSVGLSPVLKRHWSALRKATKLRSTSPSPRLWQHGAMRKRRRIQGDRA